MPEPLLHFAVTFTLAKTRYDLKWSIILGIIGLIPDLDVIIRIHRWATHSIILVTLAITPIYLLARRKSDWVRWIVVASYLAVTGHILLDLFQAYTPILYPLTTYIYQIKLELGVIIQGGISPQINMGISAIPNQFTQFQSLDAPIFTSQGFIISTILIVMSILLTTDKEKFRERVARIGI